MNLYAYVGNDPLNFIDPWGLAARSTSWDLANIFPEGAPIVTIGRTFGAVAAYAQGVITGDETLTSVALEGLSESRQANVDTLIMLGTLGRGKTYQTYTKTNPRTGQVYCGRTSGCGTSEQNIARREGGHHMNKEGFGPAVLDKSSSNAAAIRGREQQVIDALGGAKSTGGTSGNPINGISPRNPRRDYYMNQAKKEFGG